MSNTAIDRIKALPPMEVLAQDKIKETFIKVIPKDGVTVYEREKTFAIQALMANPKLGDDKFSLYTSMINLALSGLTLNPNLGLAYLIPNKGKATLRFSFQGKIDMLTNHGAIRYVSAAEIVYDCDEFQRNMGKVIKHIPKDPRPKEAKEIGAYIIVIMPDGGEKHLYMSTPDINKRKAKAMTQGIWEEWREEMIKKTLIHNFYKTVKKSPELQAKWEIVEKVENDEEIKPIF